MPHQPGNTSHVHVCMQYCRALFTTSHALHVVYSYSINYTKLHHNYIMSDRLDLALWSRYVCQLCDECTVMGANLYIVLLLLLHGCHRCHGRLSCNQSIVKILGQLFQLNGKYSVKENLYTYFLMPKAVCWQVAGGRLHSPVYPALDVKSFRSFRSGCLGITLPDRLDTRTF